MRCSKMLLALVVLAIAVGAGAGTAGAADPVVIVPAATPGWTYSGVYLRAGDVVTITATGCGNYGEGCVGPDGWCAPWVGCSAPSYFFGPGLIPFSLVGAVEKPDGSLYPPFLVGSGPTVVTTPGWLLLVFNDQVGQQANNSGAYTATIQWRPTKPELCKQGTWSWYGVFKNQGDCVSYVATHGTNQPSNG